MNLREYLRKEWSDYIRQFLIGNKCEHCGKEGPLEFHHMDRFEDLLMETLKQLHLKERDTDDYTKDELNNISTMMLGRQMKIKHKTLCKLCHKKVHEEEYNPNKYSDFGGYFFIDINAVRKDNISPFIFTRFIRLAAAADYHNILEKDIQKILKLDTNDTVDTLKYLRDNSYIKVEKDKVIINSKYAKKGTCSFNERNIFSVKNFNLAYEKMDKIKHDIFGKVLYENKEGLQSFEYKTLGYYADYFKLKHLRECGVINIKKKKIMLNPNIVILEEQRKDDLKKEFENF